MASNRKTISILIDSKYFGLIIGAKGVTIKQIKSETNTRITLPKPNETGPIEIAGESQECVDAARKRIESIVELEQNRAQMNHLVHFRITDETIKTNFGVFMEEVLADGSIDGLTDSMFMRPVNLNISFVSMTLLDENDLARATDALNECVEKVIVPVKNEFGKIEVKVSGVDRSHKLPPEQTKVVFAKIESAALQKIADGIREYFGAKGLSKRDPEHTSVKMDMKLIITSLAFSKSEADADRDGLSMWRRSTPRRYLDVRPILAEYVNYEFGTQEITEISLSSIDEKDSDGCYSIVASVKL